MTREIDYSRYDYVKVGHYSNVVMELPKHRTMDKENDSKTQLCSFMDALIYKVALKHPEWTIVAVGADWNTRLDRWYTMNFTVYCGTEYIGRIERDGWNGEDNFKYEIYNERVDNARTRRGGVRTKDLKKALKTVEEFFKPKSLDERARAALRDMSSHVTQVEYRASRTMYDVMATILPTLTAYMTANMSTMRPALEELGTTASTLDKFMEAAEKRNDISRVKQSRTYNRGVTVVLVGDRYLLISDADKDNGRLVTASQLDPDMRRKIGVLKVFDDNENAVEGVGMRLNATTFYLVG